MRLAEYQRVTEKALRKRRVRTLCKIASRHLTMPVGSEGVIARKWKGLEIDFDPCEHCGVQATISRIDPRQVELLPVRPSEEQLL